MRPKTAFISALLCAASMFSLWSAVAHSQGSGSSRTDSSKAIQSQTTRPQTPDEFYSSFWNHIVKKDAAYNSWKPLAREKTDDGVENPHGSASRTYTDKIAAGDPNTLPIGSILVREDYETTGKRKSISVMYRVKDFDKDHGNWYWFKYQETGSIARDTGNKAMAGKMTSCIDCHAKAGGNDFVFSNDAIDAAKTPKDATQSNDPKKSAKE